MDNDKKQALKTFYQDELIRQYESYIMANSEGREFHLEQIKALQILLIGLDK